MTAEPTAASGPGTGSHPVVAILAGGGSRRMGRDKATIELGGEPIIQSIARAASGAGLRCVVVGRSSLEQRPGGVRSNDGVGSHNGRIEGVDAWLEDETPGEGPLAALATALRALHTEVILVACDMPLLDSAAFEWLARAEFEQTAIGLVPRNDETLEPLFARFRPQALPAIDAVLADGRRSIGALIAGGGVAIIDIPQWLRPRLANVNTPEELEQIVRVREEG